MENKRPKLINQTAMGLNEFVGGVKSKIKEKASQSNIVWETENELSDAKRGHEVCLDKMNWNDYQKNAVLEKARRDIEERNQIDIMRANLKK